MVIDQHLHVMKFRGGIYALALQSPDRQPICGRNLEILRLSVFNNIYDQLVLKHILVPLCCVLVTECNVCSTH